jgi:hypothetical protein
VIDLIAFENWAVPELCSAHDLFAVAYLTVHAFDFAVVILLRTDVPVLLKLLDLCAPVRALDTSREGRLGQLDTALQYQNLNRTTRRHTKSNKITPK